MTVQFDTSDFRRSHGKQPRGRGVWAFDVGGSWEFTPRQMTFTEAKEWVSEKARDAGVTRVVVGP